LRELNVDKQSATPMRGHDCSVVGGMTAWLLSGQAGKERARAGETNAAQPSDSK
jgi:hypothetical protein